MPLRATWARRHDPQSKHLDLLLSRRHLDLSRPFLRHLWPSLRNFRRSRIHGQSRWTCDRAFLLDTNMIAELVRHPHGRFADRIAAMANSTFVPASLWRQSCAAELRYGVVRKASVRLAAQLEAVLAPSMYSRSKHPWTAASMVNVDSVYGELRARLERAGQSICATICSLPLTP